MKPSQAKNLYEMFEIEKTASPREIDIAFRKLALLWHPDKHLDDYEDADAEFKILMNAYCILSDPNRRRDYDRFHFKKTVSPNYGKYRDERLSLYRARKRASINRMLKAGDRSYGFYKSLAAFSLLTMLVIGGLFLLLFYDPAAMILDARLGDFFIIPILLLNGSFICYLISKKEMAENRKRQRSLAIKLYAYVDD
ncbi:MAG: DnaJ domain-containing protein [Pirellulales bacterium]|nr:DnaJ domain-containing protein [Pirellulales bacterium]